PRSPEGALHLRIDEQVLARKRARELDVFGRLDADRFVGVWQERHERFGWLGAMELKASNPSVGEERTHGLRGHVRDDPYDEQLRVPDGPHDLAGLLGRDAPRGCRDEVQPDRARAEVDACERIIDGSDAAYFDVR